MRVEHADSSWTRSLAGVVLLLVSGACSHPPETPSAGIRNLLLQKPTAEVATEGVLVPLDWNQWGAHDAGGWDSFTRTYRTGTVGLLGEGAPYMTIAGPSAALQFCATGPRERSLSLLCWAGVDAAEVQVSLNDVPLTKLTLSVRPEHYEVPVPAAFWLRGTNQLELLPIGETESNVALAEVRTTPAESVAYDAKVLFFDGGTSAAWQLELAGPGVVDFELETAMAGIARVVLEAFDPASGSREQLESRDVYLELATPQRGRLLLPAPEGRVLEVSVHWDADADAPPLALRQLDLFEEHPLRRPSILFVSIDTLSASNLSIYGYGRPTTPRLAELAADSVLFEQARSNAPWTIPSYASQFTGLYAWANKSELDTSAGTLPAWQLFEVADQRWTLVESLRAAGYGTAAFVDNLWLTKVPGFAQGFDSFDADAAQVGHEDPNGGMRIVLPRTADFLKQHAGRPNFAFAQIVDVHGPYLPNAPFKGSFSDQLDPDAVTQLPIVRTSPTLFGGIPSVVASGRFPDPAAMPTSFGAEYFQADYDEKILELDAALGDFFDDLKQAGLYDDLLIVFSADHGESMIDHDFNFRHGLVYDSAIHVPLVIKLPKSAHAGTRVTSPVQLVDLYPTLSELLGLPANRPDLHGRSLVPALEEGTLEEVPLMSQGDIMDHCALTLGRWKLVVGVPKNTAPDTLLSSPKIQERLFALAPKQFDEIFGSPPPIPASDVCLVLEQLEVERPTLTWALIKTLRASGPLVELYDTVADPREEQNVAADHKQLTSQLLELMTVERDKADESRTLGARQPIQISDEMLEELRRLGYVGND